MNRKLDIVLPHLKTGGIERSVVCMLPALIRQNLSVRLVLGRREGSLLSHVPNDVTIVHLSGRRASASIRDLAHLLTGRDVVMSGTNALNLAVLAATRLLPRTGRPAVIISEHTSADEYLAAARHRHLRRLMIRGLYPFAARLAVPIRPLADGWTDLIGKNAPRIQEIPNAIFEMPDTDFAPNISPRDPNLLVAMGRLHPAKGHDRVIAAFALAQQARPELRLEIWGDGHERKTLEDQITAAGLGRQARLCGLSDQPLATLARAGALVMGSRREGFGNVVVEALSVGTPVIATDCLGPRAILSNWPDAGRIAPNHDSPEALALMMTETCGAAQTISSATRAAEPLRRHYSADRSAASMMQMIDEIGQTGFAK